MHKNLIDKIFNEYGVMPYKPKVVDEAYYYIDQDGNEFVIYPSQTTDLKTLYEELYELLEHEGFNMHEFDKHWIETNLALNADSPIL